MAGKKVTHDAIKDVLGRALRDEAFRKKLLDAPADTLKQEGFEHSDSAVEFFKSLKQGGFDGAAKKLKVHGGGDGVKGAGDM